MGRAYDPGYDTTSCDYLQDLKQSSSRNIEHGYVEPETFNQMPIASIVQSCVPMLFSIFLNLFSKRPREKKEKEKERKRRKKGRRDEGVSLGIAIRPI